MSGAKALPSKNDWGERRTKQVAGPMASNLAGSGRKAICGATQAATIEHPAVPPDGEEMAVAGGAGIAPSCSIAGMSALGALQNSGAAAGRNNPPSARMATSLNGRPWRLIPTRIVTGRSLTKRTGNVNMSLS